jgi:hypothetical protein
LYIQSLPGKIDAANECFRLKKATGEKAQTRFFCRFELANHLFLNDLPKFIIAVPYIRIVMMDDRNMLVSTEAKGLRFADFPLGLAPQVLGAPFPWRMHVKEL